MKKEKDFSMIGNNSEISDDDFSKTKLIEPGLLKNEEEPEKVKKERKKRTSKVRVPYTVFNISLCNTIAGIFPFLLLSIVLKDENYKLTDSEKFSLAPLWDSVLEKHLPEVIAKWSDEIALVTAISMLIIQKSNLLSIINEK